MQPGATLNTASGANGAPAGAEEEPIHVKALAQAREALQMIPAEGLPATQAESRHLVEAGMATLEGLIREAEPVLRTARVLASCCEEDPQVKYGLQDVLADHRLVKLNQVALVLMECTDRLTSGYEGALHDGR